MDLRALALSFELALATTLSLAVLGLPLAFWIARKPSFAARAVESLVSLPLVLPPTVLGFYLLLALNKIHLAFSFSGLLVSSIFYSFPFALQPLIASFQAIDESLFEASWTLGRSKLDTFRRVALPLATPGLVSAGILAFAHTVGEFGVVLMIGGNIPGQTRTLSIALFDDVEALNYEAAHRTAAFLLVFSFLALLTTSGFRRRTAGLV